MTYRVGNHQPQNLYRDDQYIGVMFTAEDAALAVEALNALPPAGHPRSNADGLRRLHPTCIDVTNLRAGRPPYSEWACGPDCPTSRPAPKPTGEYAAFLDSCTCVFPPGVDPACPVHQGRRARGPKPPPVGEGCICDGSGRTCPRHGAVI